MQNPLKDKQYKKALYKYAESLNSKKKKTRKEKLLEDDIAKRYVIYARKSTEDDKRQVESIQDQIDHCKRFAKQNELEVVAVISEERSAKKAGRRTRFTEMLETINKGHIYNSILSWHPDRLARNMKESGEILDMLDNQLIADLKFPSYTFNNDAAGKMTLSILFAMAKEFSDKLSDDTKRGQKKKIKEGRYCGQPKRGYYPTKKERYYRPDANTFEIYSQAWKDYKSGKTQKEILDSLKNEDIDITKNGLSNLFMDPFYAGMYCYGSYITDLTSVDTKFQCMITPEDFIKLQKINRSNPRGWKKSGEFRPFNNFIICKDCGNFMTAGVTKGKSQRYLTITCGNSKCKEKRVVNNIKPNCNTIRGSLILDFAIKIIEKSLKIDKRTYTKVKKKYLEEKNLLIKINKEEVALLKAKKFKLEKKGRKISNKILDIDSKSEIHNRLTQDYNIISNQTRDLNTDITKLTNQNKEYELEIEDDFPSYERFLNFFENIVPTLKKTDNAYLIDQLVKLVLLNTTVGDKKVLTYTLREPFKSYNSLKFLSGVDDGT
jgi:site-specific DNA recombinase